MRMPVKALFVLSFIGICSAAALLVFWYSQATQHILFNEGSARKAHTHISIILPLDGGIFFDQLSEGAVQEALRRDVAVEFLHYSDILPETELRLLLRQVSWMQTDGVLLYLPESYVMTAELDELISRNIPVVTLIHDNPFSMRTGHAGFDNELLARELVRLMLSDYDPLSEPESWAVFFAGDDSSQGLQDRQRMLSIMQAMIEPYPSISIDVVQHLAATGHFEGEKRTASLLRDMPGINGIVVAAPRTLGGVVHALIDQNKLGDIRIAGMDSNDEIVTAIGRNLVQGTIYRYPEHIGRNGIRLILDASRSQYIPEYTLLNYTAVDRNNLHILLPEGIR